MKIKLISIEITAYDGVKFLLVSIILLYAGLTYLIPLLAWVSIPTIFLFGIGWADLKKIFAKKEANKK